MSDFRPDSDMRAMGLAIKRAIQRDIKQSSEGRAEIAHLLSARVGRPITLAQIDAFASESKTHRFPLDLLAAWVSVTGSRLLLDIVLPAAGYVVADERDQKMATYARTILEREALERHEAKLKNNLLELSR